VLADLGLPEGATPMTSGGTLLPPLRVQSQLVPGVLVVDIASPSGCSACRIRSRAS